MRDNAISIKDLIREYKKKEKLDNTKERILKSLSDAEEEHNPFLIHTIVADGKGHQAGRYGWFGSFSQEIDENEWKKEYLKLLEEHKDDFMVNLDCHI